MDKMETMRDRVVMITGASSGIGAATARLLVARGARVVLGARRERRLEALVEELGSDRAFFRVTDVTDRDQVVALAEAGIEEMGRIDVLVNNAGIMPLSFLDSGRVEEWDRMIDVNIKGALWAIHAVLGHMLERGSGHVVNISSVAGHHVQPSSAVYSATKFAVRAISEGLRQETVGKIRVTNVSPGAFETELADSIGDPKVRRHLDRFKKLRGAPERVAETIAFVLEMDSGVGVNEIVIRPVGQGP